MISCNIHEPHSVQKEKAASPFRPKTLTIGKKKLSRRERKVKRRAALAGKHAKTPVIGADEVTLTKLSDPASKYEEEQLPKKPSKELSFNTASASKRRKVKEN